jgi:hypothetical protein
VWRGARVYASTEVLWEPMDAVCQWRPGPAMQQKRCGLGAAMTER